MKKYLIYIVVSTGLILAGEFQWNAKNTAIADCGFSIPLDAGSIFYNPAFAGAFGSGVLSAGYGIPFAGIESSAKSGYLAYTRPLGWSAGLAVIGNYEDISAYKMFRIGGDFAYRIALAGTLSLGMGIDWLQRSYDIPADDPLHGRGNPSAVSFDAGVLWQMLDKFAFGLSAMDINEPNLAIEENAPASKLPKRIGAGISYKFTNYFIPELAIVYRSFTIGEKSNPEYILGFYGGLKSNTLFWRGGISPDIADIGVGWHLNSVFGGLDFDYAFGLPLQSSLRSAGQTQHYFGVTFYGKQVRVRKGDLEIRDLQISGEFKAKKPLKISATVINDSRIKITSVPCALTVYDGKKWKMIYPTKYIDSLASKQSVEMEWNWKPKIEGKYTIRITADDDGNEIPDISGHIDEKNEKNNQVSKKIVISASDTLVIEPKISTLSATQLIVKVEEEPVVPVVFFPAGSAMFDKRGSQFLDVLADRLSQNPDAILTVYGYYDVSDGDKDPRSLADARAETVKNNLLAYNTKLANRIYTVDNYDVQKSRLTSRYVKNDPRINQENRRVEFSVSVRSDIAKFSENDAIRLLQNNDDFLLVIIGKRTKSENARVGFARADSVRKKILSKNPHLHNRIVVEEEIGEDRNIIFEIDPDGVIVRPRERYPVSEQWKDPEPARNVIEIRRKGFENIHRWKIVVESEDRNLVHTIANGSGIPPDSIVWDWSVGKDRFLAPNNEYGLHIKLETAEGNREYFANEKIHLVPRQKIEAIENMLLVEFVFDESEPLSKYLERRLFSFAEKFVARVDSGYSQSAEIQGHTDNIGSERRNTELSSQRANREYFIMRKFIAYFADVPVDKLDKWLTEHDCSLSYKGYASEKPYTLRGKILGDNSSSYGRNINRRVTLEYHYEKDLK